MKKLRDFISDNRRAVLGFLIYYVLFLLFVVVGTVRAWPLLLLNGMLLLLLLCASLGDMDNHFANFHAFRQQPFTAQDLTRSPSDYRGLELSPAFFLNLPPALYLLVRLVLRFLQQK